jgi:hypothetical protein
MLAVLASAALAIGVAAWWAKSEHTPAVAMQVAQDFLQKLEAQQFSQAFELTVKQGYVGQTPDELRAISKRELCRLDRLAYTFPFQSNGNRIRRLMSGREVDMPQVQVEFTGQCLVSVVVRKTAGNTWRVFRFARHAG